MTNKEYIHKALELLEENESIHILYKSGFTAIATSDTSIKALNDLINKEEVCNIMPPFNKNAINVRNN
jgi:hypothetical protein